MNFAVSIREKRKHELSAHLPLPEKRKFFLAITNGLTARSAAFVSRVTKL